MKKYIVDYQIKTEHRLQGIVYRTSVSNHKMTVRADTFADAREMAKKKEPAARNLKAREK